MKSSIPTLWTFLKLLHVRIFMLKSLFILCSTESSYTLFTNVLGICVYIIYVLVKALLRVCTENTAQGGMSRDKAIQGKVECS